MAIQSYVDDLTFKVTTHLKYQFNILHCVIYLRTNSAQVIRYLRHGRYAQVIICAGDISGGTEDISARIFRRQRRETEDIKELGYDIE